MFCCRKSIKCLLKNTIVKKQLPAFTTGILPRQPVQHDLCLETESEKALEMVKDNMKVYDDFITEEEEKSLLDELDPHLKRRKYEQNHWDDAILTYREMEKTHWNKANKKVFERVHSFAFPKTVKRLPAIHVLDLAEDGLIKPHIDSVRFCGRFIVGLSLASASVMRLIHSQEKTLSVKVLLNRRSLYIMQDQVRFDFSHEILPKEESYFKGVYVHKTRRVSLITRCEPEMESCT